MVTLSRREMAALRSSLPSPTKHKGRQMAETMGIKTGAWGWVRGWAGSELVALALQMATPAVWCRYAHRT